MNAVNHVLKGVPIYKITSPFGFRNLVIGSKTVSHMHNGIDIANNGEVVSVARGKIIRVIDGIKESQTSEIIAKAQSSLYYGNAVYIQYGNNVQTRSAHLQSSSIPSNIKLNSIVEKGQTIGIVGKTGYSTGTHLHFEVLENGVRVDPAPYLLGTKNFVDYNENVPINREGLATLSVNTTSLRIRKTPNGELVGTLPQGAILPYFGKSGVVNGYEWAEVLFDNKIGYCALQSEWNTINHAVKEIVKTVEVMKEVVKPIDETIQKEGYTLRVVIS